MTHWCVINNFLAISAKHSVTGRKGYSWEQIRIQIIKLFFLCVLDIEWNKLDYLQSKNNEWILLIYCAKQSCFPYVLRLELPHSRDIQQKQALTPNYSLCFSPCLSFSRFTQVLLRDERCFSFFRNFWLCCCVCGFLRNGYVGFLNSCSGQTRADDTPALELFPLHYWHFPWGRTVIYLMEWHVFQRCQSLNIK